MKVFNTLTNQKENFTPLRQNKVSMYVCGPTVYDHAHIGNTRPMIVFDVLRRLFEYRGYEVTYVSNYTDVDDKIIRRAMQEGKTELEIANTYIQAYEKVRADLHLMTPTYTPRVTETMPDIIAFISALIENGSAYVVDGDVYFRVSSVKDYGCLSGIRIEELIEGASERVDGADKKESSLDFALWKKTNEGIQWDSPWSKGRPGWHTECVVMINKLFEDGRIDIHGGGQDLKFPHHENEIAQSMAYHQHKIANYWMHNQMININNEKMSKSLGNVKWAKDLIVELGVNVYKWLMLSTHYRNPLNFTEEVVNNVKKEVAKVERVVSQSALQLQIHHLSLNAPFDQAIVDHLAEVLEDDLNTSNGLTCLLDEVKQLNLILRQKELDGQLLETHFASLMAMADIFGFVFKYRQLSEEEIDLYVKWQALKQEKAFEQADELRLELTKRGII